MTFDKIEIISKSLVHHGANNDRVYLMKIHPEEVVDELIDQLYDLAVFKRYSKIVVKVPGSLQDLFLKHNFKLEATVPNFYQGVEQGCFLGKYLNDKRSYLSPSEKTSIDEVKNVAIETNDDLSYELPNSYDILKLGVEDIVDIAKIYREVFQFYPFPVFEEAYLQDTIRSNVQYYGIHNKGKLIAVSSAEIDAGSRNVEMTDFATLHKYLGRNLSYYLLQKMMRSMIDEGIQTAYTIARSTSYGMNKTFARQGFHFGGTLVNNTLIGERIESMNVWYKKLK